MQRSLEQCRSACCDRHPRRSVAGWVMVAGPWLADSLLVEASVAAVGHADGGGAGGDRCCFPPTGGGARSGDGILGAPSRRARCRRHGLRRVPAAVVQQPVVRKGDALVPGGARRRPVVTEHADRTLLLVWPTRDESSSAIGLDPGAGADWVDANSMSARRLLRSRSSVIGPGGGAAGGLLPTHPHEVVVRGQGRQAP